MKTPFDQPMTLWRSLQSLGNAAHCAIDGQQRRLTFAELVRASFLAGRGDDFRGRSVLIYTADQLSAAAALVELDGIAQRLILCPPDFPEEYLPFVKETAAVDAVVFDSETLNSGPPAVGLAAVVSEQSVPAAYDRSASLQTEWVLLTSGTTGLPKLVAHTLESLAGAVKEECAAESSTVWSTFYDIRRFGGLQIFLRALLTGTSLVLSDTRESTGEFLARAAACAVTHISGTPSHWRRALMTPSAAAFQPRYVRLSGEIADQAVLNQLQSFYPKAIVVHAFASTEAGVAFEVRDCLEGFPASFLNENSGVELRIDDGSLRIRSNRLADRYLGPAAAPLTGAEGFVDTGDMVALDGDRCYFVGRRDGMINVGGLKVHPEEVEAVINRHPVVRMALVRTRKNPITGALVVADVVLKPEQQSATKSIGTLEREIQRLCRDTLPAHKVPAIINFVPALAVAESGKLMRSHA